MRYLPRDGSGAITLVRFNGPHGEYNDRYDPAHPHAEFHVHRATQSAIETGLKPEKFAERSKEFASFKEALPQFLITINPEDPFKYFPDDRQPVLPFPSREDSERA